MKIYDPFFHPEAKHEMEGDRYVIRLPDGRSLSFQIEGMRYHNPNAVPMPPIDVPNMPDWPSLRRSDP